VSEKLQMKLTSALLLSTFVSIVSPSSLYFYMDDRQQKCFYEELSNGLAVLGQFSTEVFDGKSQLWREDPNLKVHITVDVESTLARETDKTARSKGIFNFVATDHGTHVICVSISGSRPGEEVRLHMAFFYGDDVQTDHSGTAADDLNHKVLNLKFRADGLLREVEYAREREEEFRNLSEDVNHKVMWWTLYQFILLGKGNYY
jgi:hypothetical protein